jgi:hypothetical protein
MSLNPNEAQMVYGFLVNKAKEYKLGWVVDDVERQISLGKEVPKKFQTEISNYLPDDLYSKKRKGKTESFIVGEPYSEKEKLYILIDAIEATTCGLSRAVLQTIEFLKSKLKDLDSLEFIPDIEHGRGLLISKEFIYKTQQVEQLFGLLKELKEVI